MPFKRPKLAEIVSAIGSLSEIEDEETRMAFDVQGVEGVLARGVVKDDRTTSSSSSSTTEGHRTSSASSTTEGPLFSPIPRPRRGDWLSEHKECLQSVSRWRNRPGRQAPHSYFTTLCLLPIGQFPEGVGPDLNALAQFLGCFLGVDVRVEPVVDECEVEEAARIGMEGQKQLKTTTILSYLRRRRTARDCFATVAVTLTDLFPRDEWNFVFGIASLMDGVGVFSFSRYDPLDRFFVDGVQASPEDAVQIFRRSIKTLAHESLHILGLKHCIAFHCLMNGSNHDEEADGKPLYLCPLCLRKLYESTDVAIVERYTRVLTLSKDMGLEEEAMWFERRLRSLGPNAEEREPNWEAPATNTRHLKRRARRTSL